MSKLDRLNDFTARIVADMDRGTRAAWDALSEAERKAIAAASFYAAEFVKLAR